MRRDNGYLRGERFFFVVGLKTPLQTKHARGLTENDGTINVGAVNVPQQGILIGKGAVAGHKGLQPREFSHGSRSMQPLIPASKRRH